MESMLTLLGKHNSFFSTLISWKATRKKSCRIIKLFGNESKMLSFEAGECLASLNHKATLRNQLNRNAIWWFQRDLDPSYNAVTKPAKSTQISHIIPSREAPKQVGDES